ncbi:MAG: aldo/keto reductase, partial [Gammaproteobacteria bacterium]|nr:aldo/keto reductase [Gammaproteobacteria bacterium]
TAALVAEALRAGFRGIDTACQPRHYNEAGVGDGIAQCLGTDVERGELYIQTKFSPLDAHDPANVPYDASAPIAEQVEQSFARSLENLGVDLLDGLVLHSPYGDGADTLEAWRALEAVAARGGTKLIGISNCYSLALLEALYDAAEIKPSVVQNRFYRDTRYDRAVRAFCRDHGIVYQSFWTLTANPDLLASDEITAIAARYQRSPEQVLFRYLTQHGVAPLTGTTSREHMREDLAIFEFELADDECQAIGKLVG